MLDDIPFILISLTNALKENSGGNREEYLVKLIEVCTLLISQFVETFSEPENKVSLTKFLIKHLRRNLLREFKVE